MQTATQGSSALFFLLFAGMCVWILLSARSQKKREQEMKTKIDALQKGDQIVLANGIIGTVAGFKDEALEVKVAEGVKLTVLKTAVARFLTDRTQTVQGGKK